MYSLIASALEIVSFHAWEPSFSLSHIELSLSLSHFTLLLSLSEPLTVSNYILLLIHSVCGHADFHSLPSFVLTSGWNKSPIELASHLIKRDRELAMLFRPFAIA